MEDEGYPWNFHTCRVCKYRSKSNFLMFKHLLRHEARSKIETFSCTNTPERYECEYCEFETDFKVILNKHIGVFHAKKEAKYAIERILGCYKCRRCNFQTFSLLLLIKHSNVHVIVTESLRSEQRIVNGLKWFVCSYCPYKSRNLSNKRKHERRKHSDPRELIWYKCEKCGTNFKEEYLKQHILRRHAGEETENLLRCKQCPYVTISTSTLQNHVLSKHKSKEWFKCEQCSFRSLHKKSLNRHVTVKHHGNLNVNWFACEQCSFKSRSRIYLKRHTGKVHSNSKCWQFTCAHCSLMFSRKGDLNDHISIKHPGRKSANLHKCELCLYKAKRKTHLELHLLRKHSAASGANYLRCGHCSYKSKWKLDIREHILFKHSGVEQKLVHM